MQGASRQEIAESSSPRTQHRIRTGRLSKRAGISQEHPVCFAAAKARMFMHAFWQTSRTISSRTMIAIIPHDPIYDVIPQAILWRPLNYFTSVIREGEDGLDLYRGASFSIGNRLNFDLRTYRGHPAVTVTLYLPEGFDDQKDIIEAINLE
jgi:hypothetical protein